MMTVLIVSCTADAPTVESVSGHLEARGVRVLRLETDRFPMDVRCALQFGGEPDRLQLQTVLWEADLAAVDALWYRRVDAGRTIPDGLDRQIRNAAVMEARRTLMGLMHCVGAFQLDPMPAVRRAEHKPLQLAAARRLGLDVPRTIISNDPQAVRRFVRTCPGGVVAKMLESPTIHEGGVPRVVYATPLGPDDLERLDSLRLCPMIFQERIPAALEVRVTVVGKQCFAAGLKPSSGAEGEVDWRRRPERTDEWQPGTLPARLSEALLALHDHFGLNYGACDLIRTAEDRWCFLELNPLGQFLWLEHAAGLPISQAIADLLTRPNLRRISSD